MTLPRLQFLLALVVAGPLAAQSASDNGKLLATFQNPVGDLISAPFQNNVNVPIGEFSRVQDVLNIQQVVSIHLNNHPQDLPYPKWQVRLQVASLFPSAK